MVVNIEREAILSNSPGKALSVQIFRFGDVVTGFLIELLDRAALMLCTFAERSFSGDLSRARVVRRALVVAVIFLFVLGGRLSGD